MGLCLKMLSTMIARQDHGGAQLLDELGLGQQGQGYSLVTASLTATEKYPVQAAR
jgi:hypothetical protein